MWLVIGIGTAKSASGWSENGYHADPSACMYGYGEPWCTKRLMPAVYARPARTQSASSPNAVTERTLSATNDSELTRRCPLTCAADAANVKKSKPPPA